MRVMWGIVCILMSAPSAEPALADAVLVGVGQSDVGARRVDESAQVGESAGIESLELRYFPSDADVYINGELQSAQGERNYYRLFGERTLPVNIRIEREGYAPYRFRFADVARLADGAGLASGAGSAVAANAANPANSAITSISTPNPNHNLYYDPETARLGIEIRLERLQSAIIPIARLPSGSKPKSLAFAGEHFLSAQLNGAGIDIYNSRTLAQSALRLSPQGSSARGFVEFAVSRKRNEVWVSQMEGGRVHVLDIATMEKIAEFSTRGSWSKVIAFDREENYAFVSNWLSGTVSVFRTEGFAYIGSIRTGGIPRGLALSTNNAYLYVADYESGWVLSYDISFLSDGDSDSGGNIAVSERIHGLKPYATLSNGQTHSGRGAKRHIVIADSLDRMFVSDMFHGAIFVYRQSDGAFIDSLAVGQKLNTIALDPQERYLYISSRGRNNPESYLIAGPDFGKIYVMDTQTLEVVDWVWGMNQPTGLAVSPSGEMLVASNFIDSQIDVYDVSALSAQNPLMRAIGLERVNFRNFILANRENL